jgi:hypothetical protein
MHRLKLVSGVPCGGWRFADVQPRLMTGKVATRETGVNTGWGFNCFSGPAWQT